MWCNVAQIVLQVVVILLFKPLGLTVMVVAYSVFLILWLLAWHIVAKRLIGLSLRHTFADIVPFMLIAAAVMVATHYLTLWLSGYVVVLIARVVIAALLYVGAMRLFHAEIMSECIAYFKKKR